MIPRHPVFLVSHDRAAEGALLDPNWPVVRVEDLKSLEDLRRGNWDFVFPLVSPASGHVQGMLEFLGLPYAGSSMAGFVWALRQNDLQPAVAGPVTQQIRATCLETLVPAEGLDADLRFLRLSGWSLVSAQGSGAQVSIRVEVSPPLRRSQGFLALLEARGISMRSFFDAEIDSGWTRFEAEHSLKTHYKDTI